MTKKILKVDAKTHKSIKIQASQNDMTINDYIEYLAELNDISPLKQLEDFRESILLRNKTENIKDYIKGLDAGIAVLKGHINFVIRGDISFTLKDGN